MSPIHHYHFVSPQNIPPVDLGRLLRFLGPGPGVAPQGLLFEEGGESARARRHRCDCVRWQHRLQTGLAVRRALFSSAGPNLVDCGLFLFNLQSNAVHSGSTNCPSKQACWLASVLQPLAKRRRRALRMHNDVSFFVRSARELRRVARGSLTFRASFCAAPHHSSTSCCRTSAQNCSVHHIYS